MGSRKLWEKSVTMNDYAKNLRKQLDIARMQHEENAKSVKRMENTCSHDWGETIEDHIHHKAYTIPGDPPGVGGSDHQFSVDVPAKTDERWKRTCNKCGKVEFTEETSSKVQKTPQF